MPDNTVTPTTRARQFLNKISESLRANETEPLDERDTHKVIQNETRADNYRISDVEAGIHLLQEDVESLSPDELYALNALVTYVHRWKEAHVFLEKTTALSQPAQKTTASNQPAQSLPPVTRDRGKRRRVINNEESDEEVCMSSAKPLSAREILAEKYCTHPGIGINDEEEWETDHGEDDDEDTKALSDLLQEYMQAETAAEAKKTNLSIEKSLDKDIQEIIHHKPFDSHIPERVLVKDLRKIPWIPNFKIDYPPQWPKSVSHIADKSYVFRSKRYEEDFRQYNRLKENSARNARNIRVREDRRKSATQMLHIAQLRLTATLFQKTRSIISFYTNLLSTTDIQMDPETQNRFRRSLKLQEEVEKFSTLQLKVGKALLAKATRDRRYAFVKNAGEMKNITQQIVDQSSIQDASGKWYMVDPASLKDDLELAANYSKNVREISQPFRSSQGYTTGGRGGFSFNGRGRGNYGGYYGGGYGNQRYGRPSYNGFGGYSTENRQPAAGRGQGNAENRNQ